jgi:hypothetical protein
MKYVVIVIAILLTLPLWASETKINSPKNKSFAPKKDISLNTHYREITWDALIPKDWDPVKRFRTIDLSALKDNDPRAIKLLDLMKSAWDRAPINPSVDGQKVKIPGFVVPIEQTAHGVSEFLLVPYFGACIHVPPPPANQIIHVISAKPIKGLRVMDVVWVTGELKAARFAKETDMGTGASGYQINSMSVTPYKEAALVTITPYNTNELHRVPTRPSP